VTIGAAFADEGKKSSDEALQQWKDFRETQTLRHEMLLELFDVNRELIKIVRNLNHHPAESDIGKLDEMDTRIGELLKKDEMYSKKMTKKWKQGGREILGQ